ncbi:MAG: hypothetical protein MUF19_00650 [Candidatus Pacebacteria bacterium]|jgi:hypothetical protein|nr:hypothetical protein [Candidatus Paceibacterota bacterium]
MKNNQKQKGGAGAEMTQIGTAVFVGIDEKRAREIVDEKLGIALRDFTAEAIAVAKERNEKFDGTLIKKVLEKQMLQAFADPSFQLLLVEAQRSAAATEREPDYDLLAELMIHRFEKKDDRVVRAAISRAIEVVDLVSDEALLALTVFHSVSYFVPRGKDLTKGLQILEELFLKIITDELPVGQQWLDHLDILDAVRTSSFGGTKSLESFWLDFNRDLCLKGIKIDSENHVKAKELLSLNKLGDTLLEMNSLSEGYVRIPVSRRSEIPNLIFNFEGHLRPPTHTEINTLEQVFDLYEDGTLPESQFTDVIDQYSTLKKLRNWWNTYTDTSIQITSVGRVLAHSNAQRIDPKLPTLN